MRLSPILVSCAIALAGCTAIKASIHVTQAETALGEARNYNAQDLAVYEYTMAVRYLEKSREELGNSDNRMTEKLAKRSIEWSDKAIIAIERGRRGIDVFDEDLQQVPVHQPAEAPLPDGDDFDPLSDDPVEPLEPLDDFGEPSPVPTPAPAPAPDDEFDFDDDELEVGR